MPTVRIMFHSEGFHTCCKSNTDAVPAIDSYRRAPAYWKSNDSRRRACGPLAHWKSDQSFVLAGESERKASCLLKRQASQEDLTVFEGFAADCTSLRGAVQP